MTKFNFRHDMVFFTIKADTKLDATLIAKKLINIDNDGEEITPVFVDCDGTKSYPTYTASDIYGGVTQSPSLNECVAEAVKRMKTIGLYQPVISDYKNYRRVQLSEPPFGACYYLDDAQQKLVREAELNYDIHVYHVVRCLTCFGDLLACLYVPDDTDEWEADHDDLAKDADGLFFPMAYVINATDPDLSEFGSIGVRLTAAAGLERVY